MTQFDGTMKALSAGAKVRRVSTWEAETVMFVQDGALVMSAHGGEPVPYDLSWYELNASDWEVLEPVKAA